MARVVPESPLPGTSPAELKVRDALVHLSDAWTIAHGVAWQSVRNGRQGDGEADFVAVHPAHGMVVIEVKGGGIEVEAGRWTSTDRNGTRHTIKNPFEQAVASKHALVRFLQDEHVLGGYLPAGHVVAFPDLANVGSLGPAAGVDVTWTAQDLGAAPRAMERVCNHWDLSTDLSRGRVDAIVARLAPTVRVRPLLRDRVQAVLADLVRLTEEQTSVLESLRRTRRAVIYGGAGTGKTVLAVERARRLAEQGFSVLLTCFNRPLGEHLRSVVSDVPLVTAASFHSFAVGELQRAGQQIPSNPPAGWWDDELPGQLPDAAERNGTTFDALVVDEGQDFDTSWWTVLSLLLDDPDDGPFYVFADTQQAIYRPAWTAPFEGLEYELSVNCRNTIPIATKVAAVYGVTPSRTLGAEGPDPILHIVDGFGGIGDALKAALHRLLVVERLRPDQVVVLSTSRDVVDVLRARRFGPHRLVPAGEPGIVAETVHRFKGLEADAVIVVAHERGREEQALLYVGLSRARAHLELICTEEVAASLGWSA